MPRRRLGVVLPLPADVSAEVDGLRRACGDGALGRVAPHVTLVPPVNVREDDLSAALLLLRDVAASTVPTVATIGPPATFLPSNPVVFLTVGGESVAVGALHDLRAKVLTPPLWRQIDHDFVPHVTIADEMEPSRIPAAVTGLADFSVSVTFDRLQLLEQTRHGDSLRRWHPIAEYRFAPPAVVGRGGVELAMWTSTVADPEAVAIEDLVAADGMVIADEDAVEGADEYFDLTEAREVPPGATPVVVMARHLDELVGVGRAWYGVGGHEVTSVVVDPSWQGRGVARQVLMALDAELARLSQRG